MVIATFGPTTGWAGKSISYADGQFALEGVGPLSAADVLAYDRQGHVSWASPGLREWVQQLAAGAAVTAPAARPVSTAHPSQQSRRFPRWAIALIVLVIVLLVVVLGGAVLATKSTQDEMARRASVKDGIRSIQVGVQTFAVDNDGTYPDPSAVSQLGMASYVDYWPTNPYTGSPMAQGTGPGDFVYTITADGTSFDLVGYGKGSEVLISAP